MKKLELTWIGKEERPRLEPRILLEDATRSHHATQRFGDSDQFDNRLIFGDNLLALKALEQEFAGRVKCIFIDPPYNTGSAFTHYDDGLEHSIWLAMMRDRLELLRNLLSDDGSLWVTLDENEAHYFKVMADEVFGRSNFVQTVVWQRKASPANDAKWLSNDHDYIFVYAKVKEVWRPNRLARTEKQTGFYTNPDNDPRGDWNSVTYTCNKTAEERPNLYYPITNPTTGEDVWPKRTAVWRCNKETTAKNIASDLLYWGKDGRSSVPRLKRFLTEAGDIVGRSVWLHEDVGHTQSAMTEQKALFPSDPFPTPKPESLLKRILELSTCPGDLVLDSVAGSGTTGAVAHKMHRKWVLVELGNHCHTHIIPRLQKVIDGTDPGGITKAVGWKGGGGFRYFKLAPSLLKKDKWDRWVVNDEYNAEMLAEALCKIEGFRFAPSEEAYWQQGRSTERDFLFATTQTMTHEQLLDLSEEVGSDRTLLVLAMAFHRAKESAYPNLTLKKIPNQVLSRCEWGKDDYSLTVQNLPQAPKAVETQPTLELEVEP